MLQLSSPTAGGAQYAVSATGNNQRESQAENIQSLCTPTCSTNGTHSDGYTGAFEGPEKLLEMWFAADAGMAHHIGPDAHISNDEWAEHRTGLRLVPRAVWSDMLDMVHCQVLSTLSNAHIDSYLLSESSFFVYPHKLVLKTCGTTTLLYAIPRILSIAREHLGAMCAHQVFYSRKNFMYPDQQEELHQSWAKEVAYLDALFPDGAAYLIGKTNRDHWHVYLSGPESEAVSNSLVGSPVLCPQMSRSSSQSTVHGVMQPSTSSDITVEILMTGLDAERMQLMYLGGASTEEGASGGAAVERKSGISDIYPNAATDSYLFTPCGFSLNGLQGDGYFTIHVTPEPHCSYASFETNVSGSGVRDLHDPQATKHLVEQVTRVFGPKFVTMTVFKARAIEAAQSVAENAWANGVKDGVAKTADAAPLSFAPVDGYKAMDRVLYEFDHYWLRYAYYIRTD